MGYGSRIDIAEMILESANGGSATKTKIIYKAFLSYVQLTEYLAVLERNDLLEYEDEMEFYITMENGTRSLQIQSKMDGLVHINYINENS